MKLCFVSLAQRMTDDHSVADVQRTYEGPILC